MEIGRLTKVAVRELWPDEAQDFTIWLIENIDVLAEALNMSLTVVGREVNVGSYAADLLAKDDDGNLIVIENQFGKTDHDHLGKFLTYMVNLEAKSAIWIAEQPAPEHVKAVSWLNEVTPNDVSVYLVRLDVVRIDNSSPAPLFSVIVRPSEEVKMGGQVRSKLAEKTLSPEELENSIRNISDTKLSQRLLRLLHWANSNGVLYPKSSPETLFSILGNMRERVLSIYRNGRVWCLSGKNRYRGGEKERAEFMKRLHEISPNTIFKDYPPKEGNLFDGITIASLTEDEFEGFIDVLEEFCVRRAVNGCQSHSD